MGWSYHFLDLTDTEKYLRRQSLDRYALYAQLSALLPLAVVLLYRIAGWASKSATTRGGGTYAAIPNSPALKSQRLGALGGWSAWARKAQWWLGEDVYVFGDVHGQRDRMQLSSSTFVR